MDSVPADMFWHHVGVHCVTVLRPDFFTEFEFS